MLSTIVSITFKCQGIALKATKKRFSKRKENRHEEERFSINLVRRESVGEIN